ncbi:MAG: ABC transporter permease [Bacilli bacterium]|nr:ABC transporter permease [Bacilli bacterium]
MFKHIYINRLKIFVKNKSLIFWTMFFPIILGTFFNMAFSNLNSTEKFNIINIAVINDTNLENNKGFKDVIDQLSKKSNDQLFNTKYTSIKDANKMLEDNKIDGYIYIKNNDIRMMIDSNGINQTIIKSVIDSYKQNISMVTNIYNYNPNVMINNIMDDINSNTDYFKDTSNNYIDATVIYFYTLIGMTCVYGGFWGCKSINESEANLSYHGARLVVSPVHKLKALIASLLAAFTVQYVEVIVLLIYLMFVIGIDFGNQTLFIFILSFFGCLAGIALGSLIGASNKKSENFKTGLLSSVSMFMSFLAGMMYMDMKMIIANNLPILGYINPVNLITDGFYALYYYPTYDRFIFNIVLLSIFTVVISLITYLFLRRKKYDSI